MDPILRWAGGKRQLLDELQRLITPKLVSDNRYFEPFIGGGSIAFSLEYDKTTISDYNEDLINVYRTIKNKPNKLIQKLKIHQENHNKEYFYKIRALDRDVETYRKLCDIEKAARIIYLNKTCYNGLYRVNSKGFFNVPIGRSSNVPDIVMEDKILNLSVYLNKDDVKILNGDFELAVVGAKEGDVIYFDPPYDYDEDGFKAYVKTGFNHNDLIRLRDLCDLLINKGCIVIISNNDTKFVRDCFRKNVYKITEVLTKRYINCDGQKRTEAKEVIIYGSKSASLPI